MKVSVYKRAEERFLENVSDGTLFVFDGKCYILIADDKVLPCDIDECFVLDVVSGALYRMKTDIKVIIPNNSEILIDGLHVNPALIKE